MHQSQEYINPIFVVISCFLAFRFLALMPVQKPCKLVLLVLSQAAFIAWLLIIHMADDVLWTPDMMKLVLIFLYSQCATILCALYCATIQLTHTLDITTSLHVCMLNL